MHKKLENSFDVIDHFYKDVTIINRDRGNNGFFIRYGKYGHTYTYISKKSIINFISGQNGYSYKDRQRKLIHLKIMND